MARRSVTIVTAVAFVLILSVGLVAVGAAEDTDESDADPLVHSCAADPEEYDFGEPPAGNETIGWVDGVWYDEALDIDLETGLTADEFDRLSARTAARIEALRCLPFERLPPVEIIDRDEFANETAAQFEGVTDDQRTFENAQYETLLLIDSETDAVDVQEADRVTGVGGYYDFVQNRTVVITDTDDDEEETIEIDEEILAHELGHALQDQHFNLSRYDRETLDRNNGKLGVIEGDVHLIEHRYLERCEEERWSEPCLSEDGAADESMVPQNWGLWAMQYQPYSDGPSFVESVYEESGWEGVNALYEDMPTTAAHIIEPETYPVFEPASVTVQDESEIGWSRVTPGGTESNVIGRAGMAGSLLDPSFPFFEEYLTGVEEFQTGDPIDPYEYDHPATAGWQGDALYVYENQAGERGGVWKTNWDSVENREAFQAAYTELATVRGAEPGAYNYTWTFTDDSDYDQALSIQGDGSDLYIVMAPTVDSLKSVHQSVLLEERSEDDPPDPSTSPWDRFPDIIGNGDTGTTDDTDETDAIPGFGPVAALASLVAVIAWLGHRRRGG